MSDIGSAFEKAMQRVEKLGKPSDEELVRWKYVPEGEKLAAKYFKGEANLAADLKEYDDKARPCVIEGAMDVLLRNIDLPRNEFIKNTTKKAMDGIKQIKRDKTRLENIYTQMRRIFNHYEQDGERQRKEAYAQVKDNFQRMLQQAMRQQGMAPGGRIDVEGHPQFQEEWRKTLAGLDASYIKLLDEYKQEITRVP